MISKFSKFDGKLIFDDNDTQSRANTLGSYYALHYFRRKICSEILDTSDLFGICVLKIQTLEI